VISIHNHPNNGKFSISDLLIFSENPSIRLMLIVNKEGEVSFLFRPKFIELKRIIVQNILDVIPDLLSRIRQQTNNHENNFSLSTITTIKETKLIIDSSLKDLMKMGVFYSDYINQEKANSLNFLYGNEIDNDIESQVDTKFIKNSFHQTSLELVENPGKELETPTEESNEEEWEYGWFE